MNGKTTADCVSVGVEGERPEVRVLLILWIHISVYTVTVWGLKTWFMVKVSLQGINVMLCKVNVMSPNVMETKLCVGWCMWVCVSA